MPPEFAWFVLVFASGAAAGYLGGLYQTRRERHYWMQSIDMWQRSARNWRAKATSQTDGVRDYESG